MAKKFSFGSILGATARAADQAMRAASREREKQRKQSEKLLAKMESEQRKIRAKQEEERIIADYQSRGYVYVTVKSLDKYIKGASMPESLFDEMQTATMKGASKVFIHQTTLDEMDEKLAEYKAKERKLHQCSTLNDKGVAYEKEDKINLAIKCYEKNIESDYPATHSFKRLMILYRKGKDYDNELRVINRALDVFESTHPFHEEAETRKNKVLEIMQK